MQKQISTSYFFQRALEGFDQRVGNLVDKTYGIDDHHLVAGGQSQRANRRVQGGEQLVFNENPGAGERVHQGRLARIGVSHQSYGGERDFIAFFSLQGSRPFHRFQTPFQVSDTLSNPTPVNFQLSLTGPTGANAAAQSRKVGPLSRKARQKIFQLSQLHLKFSLIAARALGKDIKNE